MKILEWLPWRRSCAFTVTYEPILPFIVTTGFERANVWWVYVEKANTFDDKIGYLMSLSVVF